MSKNVKFSSLWQSLVNDGYNVGTYDEFIEKMEDSSKASSLESFLKSEYNLDDQDIERITKMERMLEEEEASKSKFPYSTGENLPAIEIKKCKSSLNRISKFSDVYYAFCLVIAIIATSLITGIIIFYVTSRYNEWKIFILSV